MSAAAAPAATAVVVNHQGRDFVGEAVASLLDQDVALDVVVVDNASTDGSPEELERRFGTRLKLLRAPRNVGFGAGNNLAIRASEARDVILLNSDAVAAPGFARALLEAAASGPRVGMVAAKVLDYDRRDVIDTVGHLIYWDGQNRGRGRLEVDAGQYDGERDALFPSGAACLLRRAMLDDVGLFDETFFLYADDAELGLRGRLAGWECRLAPGAVAYHRYSRSAGVYSPLKAYHVERNRIWLLLKLFPWPLVLASPLFTALRFGAHAYAGWRGWGAAGRYVEQRSLGSLIALVVRAQLAALRGVPRVLGERWRRRAERRIGLRTSLRLLARHRLPLAEVAFKD